MADTIVTLRPNGTALTGAWSNVGGAGSFHAATSDNNDSTYAQSTDTSVLQLNMGDVTIPTGARVSQVVVRIRVASGSTNTIGVTLYDGAGHNIAICSGVSPSTTPSTLTVGGTTTGFDGLAWTQTAVNSIAVSLTSNAAGLRVAEVYVDVYYNQRPTTSVTAPTGTITTTSSPTITWAMSDPEGDARLHYQVKLYESAQYGAGGFDPSTSAATWDPGVDSYGYSGDSIPTTPNSTYRLYVRTMDDGSQTWGDWAYSQFTLNVTPPTAPTIAATPGSPAVGDSYIPFTVTTTDAASWTMEVQRSADGGTTWAAFRHVFGDGNLAHGYTVGDFSNFAAHGASLPTQLVDYEMPLGTAVSYRARSITSGGVAGAWSSTYTQTIIGASSWIKDPYDPAYNTAIDLQLPVESDKPEKQATFEPLGRTRAVVLRDTVLGETGTLTIHCSGDDEFDALDAVRGQQRTVLVQLPTGRQWYASLGPARPSALLEDADTTTAFREVSVSFTEVDPPA